MRITVNYSPKPSPGYVPRRAVTLHNVESVSQKGVGMVELRMMFTDAQPTLDHVVSVVVIPEGE
jgi:hypothetical protein